MVLRRTARLAVVFMVLWGSVAASAATGAARQEGANPPLRFKSGEVTPERGVDTGGVQLDGQGRGYYVVQYGAPILQTQTDALRAVGDIVAYLPDFAYKVRMSPAQVAQAAGLDGVTFVGAFAAEYKLSPDLADTGLYWVRLERGVDRAEARAAIAAAGAEVVSGESDVVAIASDRATLDAVAEIAEVAWVENFAFREKHNEFGAGVIIGADAANAAGYDGSTQIVAVADTGIGDGTAAGAHPDIPASRVVSVQDWPGQSVPNCYQVFPDGAHDVDSGHGTHVSVSVLGDGGAGGVGRGTAPGASLVFQATEDYADMVQVCALQNPDGYYLLGLPNDLQVLLQAAYDQGARIHSDSWGSDAAGDYTADSASVDDFIWDNPTFLMTLSAGNSGVDGNRNGVVDNGSTGSPATAKNVLTVGASENNRQGDWSCDPGIGNGCTGQNSLFTYGSAWPADFPVAPIANDPSAGNAEQMAAFSSRGPTDDGRIKPDVVAPGTWILSGYSDLYQQGYDGGTNPQNGAFQYDGWGFPWSQTYKYMGGTSMSNPIVAGAAAVVRDYYGKAHGHEASAALTKASLINSASDLLDENNDGVNDNDFPIPNAHEGWGRVDLADSVDGSAQWVDEDTGVGTGGSMTYEYTTDGTSDLRISLVWSDFASTESASVNLVNDLDLTVTGPGGAYSGNNFSGGWSTTGGTNDRVNNVENVYIQSAPAGTWTVTVHGFNVPMGPQAFALVADGTGTAGPTPPNASFTSTCSGLDCGFTDTSTDGDGSVVSWSWDFGDGATSTAQNPSHSYAAAGTYSVALTVTDDDGASDGTTQPVTVTEAGPTTAHVGDLDAAAIDAGARWDAVATVAIHDGAEAPVAGATVAGSWGAGTSGSGSCVTGASGTCSVTRSRLRDSTTSVTFTVNSVAHVTLSYAAGDNHDPDGDSSGTSIVVAQDAGGNTAPTASFTWGCIGLACSFDASASNDPDGDIVSYDWDWGDGSGDSTTEPLIGTAYAAEGVYSVTLTVTDDGGATGISTQSVTVGQPPQAALHVGDLDASSVVRGNGWRVTVTTTVHDESDAPVSGATVNATWSDGWVGSASCVTNASGICSLSTGRVGFGSPSVTFAVDSVSDGVSPYDPGSNHDPDGDSDGTIIVIAM